MAFKPKQSRSKERAALKAKKQILASTENLVKKRAVSEMRNRSSTEHAMQAIERARCQNTDLIDSASQDVSDK